MGVRLEIGTTTLQRRVWLKDLCLCVQMCCVLCETFQRGEIVLVSGGDTEAAPTKTREWSSTRSVVLVGVEQTVSFLSVFPPAVLATELLVQFCYRSCLIYFPDC